MEKRKNVKRIFAILAVALFVIPLMYTAFINVAYYVESKNTPEVVNTDSTSDDSTSTDATTTEDENK